MSLKATLDHSRARAALEPSENSRTRTQEQRDDIKLFDDLRADTRKCRRLVSAWHRDLKPTDIVIAPTGNGDFTKKYNGSGNLTYTMTFLVQSRHPTNPDDVKVVEVRVVESLMNLLPANSPRRAHIYD